MITENYSLPLNTEHSLRLNKNHVYNQWHFFPSSDYIVSLMHTDTKMNKR